MRQMARSVWTGTVSYSNYLTNKGALFPVPEKPGVEM